MRRALFGSAEASALAQAPNMQDIASDIVILPPQTEPKRRVAKPATPKLRVTLRVGNEFEGKRMLQLRCRYVEYSPSRA